MLSPRVAASIAILFGGGLGVLGAVLARPSKQPGARPTPSFSAEPARPQGIGPRGAPVGARASASVAAVASPAQTAAAGAAGPDTQAPDAGARSPSTRAARRAGAPDLVALLFTPITDPEQRSRAEVNCANGAGGACQRLATTYEAAGHDEGNRASAMRYQRLAIGMFVRACRGLDALACYALGEMHATGRGMKQSTANAQVLIERAQMLCRINAQQPVCASLLPKAAAEDREH
ncbi:MAG: sel1 repeat family protein [Polyangiaceae bacterium]|nr:sel1 repeat family protein [Polyangiaceae bacterium]